MTRSFTLRIAVGFLLCLGRLAEGTGALPIEEMGSYPSNGL